MAESVSETTCHMMAILAVYDKCCCVEDLVDKITFLSDRPETKAVFFVSFNNDSPAFSVEKRGLMYTVYVLEANPNQENAPRSCLDETLFKELTKDMLERENKSALQEKWNNLPFMDGLVEVDDVVSVLSFLADMYNSPFVASETQLHSEEAHAEHDDMPSINFYIDTVTY